ncbi:sensor histidine kinase [Candidatus Reidiella endopervernicosa]|uniref:histidine kinase n=1 Tax=Candidatus Reidiella endopervernicosa TaxID=2738883 RepID=A0A6N0HWH8_9GAMM|nr:ATP-binding protein [Candidatus Reidiella endopervernicosa]QKQ26730.1 hypothetical protein HUE57_10875 [Candidatus Reidiella endopervernicosa]
MRNCENLMALIEELLDFSKIESGTLELVNQPFDLKSMLDGLLKLFELQVEGKGIELNYTVDASVDDVITADEKRLRQILINLINNAFKFTEQGEVLLSVEVDPEVESSLRFTVTDSGIGIPKEKQAKLFEAFTQVDASSSRKYGGTGLGLAICKRFVEMMGGSIGLESRMGEGSRFYFTIPLDQPEKD